MPWSDRLNADPLPWLLEDDDQNPGVRYFALRDLLDKAEDDPQVLAARQTLMECGPVPDILNQQHPEGYWLRPGAGYSPKYTATTWQVLFLADLGASPDDERVRRSCEYALEHSAVSESGVFSANRLALSKGVVICLNGNLLYALQRLGIDSDEPRMARAFNRISQIIAQDEQEGYSMGGLRCGANDGLPCAWGAVKMLKALLCVPPEKRTDATHQTIAVCEALLTAHDPAAADYPTRGKISPYWFKFAFPLSYPCDLIELLDVLVQLGHAQDSKLKAAVEIILSKQNAQGRWKQQNALHSRMWTNADRRERGAASKWVTLRALRLLRQLDEND